ncbi:MAG: DUF2460 domain-containing protein [Nitrospirae bacterium]|nr:DUF2460 domain-containing protein [Nitrospirota bacterium]
MSTEILTFTPAFGLKEDIEFSTLIFQADSGREKRRSKWSKPIRTLDTWLENENDAAVNLIWEFFKARKGKFDTFWVKFPTSFKVTGEAVGAGDGEQTVFNLDFFPVDTAAAKVYLNGILQVSGYTISNDLTNEIAKITFSMAPGEGVVITADYEYYIQVRFDDDKLSRELVQYKLYNTTLKFKEVLWNIYQAP